MSSLNIVMAGAGAGAVVGTDWAPRYARGYIRAGAYVSYLSKFVVGGDGTIMLNSTGTGSWEVVTTTLLGRIEGIAASSSVVVAVGVGSNCYYSSDGRIWSSSTLADSYAVAFGASVFVAGTTSGQMYTSSNGASWTLRATPITGAVQDITYSTTLSLFIAVAGSGQIYTSPDGITWTSRASGTTNDLYSVTSNGSYVVAGDFVGNMYYSSNAITWTSTTTPLSGGVNGLTWNGTYFCGVSLSTSRTVISSNATTWSLGGSLPISMIGNWVASSPTTTVTGYSPGAVAYSGSLAAWAYTGSGNFAGYDANDGIFSGGKYVLCGASTTTAGGLIAYGTDPYSLTRLTSFPSIFNAIAYGAGLYVAVGASGVVYTSPDAVNWTSRTSGVAVALYDITYATGAFVAVGATGTVILSTDGITWATQTSGVTSTLKTIVWTGTKFIVVANGSTNCITSTNGATWTTGGIVSMGTVNDMAYGNGIAVVGGTNAYAVSTNQGASWTVYAPGYSVNAVGYAFGLFTLSTGTNYFYKSTDGVTWALVDGPYFGSLTSVGVPYAIFSDGNQLLAYGNNLATYASPPPATLSL